MSADGQLLVSRKLRGLAERKVRIIKAVALLDKRFVEIGAVGQIDVSQQTVIAVPIGAQRIGN